MAKSDSNIIKTCVCLVCLVCVIFFLTFLKRMEEEEEEEEERGGFLGLRRRSPVLDLFIFSGTKPNTKLLQQPDETRRSEAKRKRETRVLLEYRGRLLFYRVCTSNLTLV